MHTRIKFVRSESGLTQDQFAAKIGISKSGLQKLESGENAPREQTIRAICSEFGINRLWLETGEGAPKLPEDEDDLLINSILKNVEEYIKSMIRDISKRPGGWEKMRDTFTAIQAELDVQKDNLRAKEKEAE